MSYPAEKVFADDADIKDVHRAEEFLSDAQAGQDAEKRMGIWQALKLYPKASAWSVAISLAVIMEGASEALEMS
jgi:SP family general alpha glucoside:H+ symporter-like MFS transporter